MTDPTRRSSDSGADAADVQREELILKPRYYAQTNGVESDVCDEADNDSNLSARVVRAIVCKPEIGRFSEVVERHNAPDTSKYNARCRYPDDKIPPANSVDEEHAYPGEDKVSGCNDKTTAVDCQYFGCKEILTHVGAFSKPSC